MTTPDRPGGTDDLRRRAQQRLARLRGNRPDASQDDHAALLHELQTHQIKLEMQNEELRVAQAELTAARDRLADLYDFAPVGYVTVSPKGQIRQANQTAAEMLGVPRIALAGRWLSSFVVRDSQPFLYDHLRRLQECGRGRHTCELCLRREDGTTFWADLDGLATPRTEDQPADLRIALRDISRRRKAEEALEQSHRYLAELNVDLERRVAERTAVAEQRANQLRALAMQLTCTEHRERRRLARILHDNLQQLLVGARLRIQRVRHLAAGDEGRAAAEETDALLSEALAVSRSLMSDLYPSVLYNVGLAAALEWLGEETMAKYELAVIVEADEQAVPGDDDLAALLFDAARELLFNVVKHADATLARVTLRRGGGEILIDVHDNGKGFAPQDLECNRGGTGLGLFSIRERLAMMGGRLELRSTAGEGTAVTLAAPVAATAPSEAPAPPAPLPATRTPAGPPATLAGPFTRILLVDDHRVLLDGLDALLSDEDDLAVVGHATNGQEAVDLAAATHPDMVVMDINMPGMDGIEATRRILAANPSVKVIALSMRDEEGVMAKMREAGAVAYVSKDRLADALVGTLRAVAAGEEPPPA